MTNLFSRISATLYPTRLISFRTDPSLSGTSPKQRVLGRFDTFTEEVNREPKRHHRDR
jgi:hypothetical protein